MKNWTFAGECRNRRHIKKNHDDKTNKEKLDNEQNNDQQELLK